MTIEETPEAKEPAATGKTAFGCMHRFADPAKIPGEKEA